ncbi:hypothetical protein [Enterovirga sp. CN4-39]
MSDEPVADLGLHVGMMLAVVATMPESFIVDRDPGDETEVE